VSGALIIVAVGAWLYFVGASWARLGRRAGEKALPSAFPELELALRHRKMGKAAAVIRRVAAVILAVGLFGVIWNIATAL
jgi:hypothetical protein